MIWGEFWSRLSGGRRSPLQMARARISSAEMPPVIYAIGDLHGRLDLLTELELLIIDHGADIDGEKWIVMLGDYVDRGPSSAQTLDHLQADLPDGWRRICLAGNHEDAMLAALKDRSSCIEWMGFGGKETLTSYGIAADAFGLAKSNWKRFSHILASHIPDHHVRFLSELPSLLSVPGVIFVHAGLKWGIPIDKQSDSSLLWQSHDDHADFGVRVVHGHSIVSEPLATRHAINVDIGAYQSGRLAAVCLKPDTAPQFVVTCGSRRHLPLPKACCQLS